MTGTDGNHADGGILGMQVVAMYGRTDTAQTEPLPQADEIYGRCANCQARYAAWYVHGDEIYGWCARCHNRSPVGVTQRHRGEGTLAYSQLIDSSDGYCAYDRGDNGQSFAGHEISCVKCCGSDGTDATTYPVVPVRSTPAAGENGGLLGHKRHDS